MYYYYTNKMKNKQKYHPVGTIPKSYIKIIERDKINTPTQIYDRSFSWLGTGTTINKYRGGIKLIYRRKPPLQVLEALSNANCIYIHTI